MNSETVVYCVVALILGMLLANMLKSVCGCKTVVEGQEKDDCTKCIEEWDLEGSGDVDKLNNDCGNILANGQKCCLRFAGLGC